MCVCSEAHVDNDQHKIIFETETQKIVLKTLNLSPALRNKFRV